MAALAERTRSAILSPERAESALAKDVPHVDREERVRGVNVETVWQFILQRFGEWRLSWHPL